MIRNSSYLINLKLGHKKRKDSFRKKKVCFEKKVFKKKKNAPPDPGEHSKKILKSLCRKKNFLIKRKTKEKILFFLEFLIALIIPFLCLGILFFDKEFKEKKYVIIKYYKKNVIYLRYLRF